MKSLIKRTVYAGLGFLGDGAAAAKNLGHELSRKARVSEVEGERIARKLQAQSSTAAKSIRKTIDAEVRKVADAIHETLREDVETKKTRPAATVKVSSIKIAKKTRTGGKSVSVRAKPRASE